MCIRDRPKNQVVSEEIDLIIPSLEHSGEKHFKIYFLNRQSLSDLVSVKH